jgi:hypothetical protein
MSNAALRVRHEQDSITFVAIPRSIRFPPQSDPLSSSTHFQATQPVSTLPARSPAPRSKP